MEIRNPSFTEDGSINVEIDHPKYGPIHFTASATEDDQFSRDVYDAALAVGPVPYMPPPQPTIAEIIAAERTLMVCSPTQGILAMGEANWNIIQAYRDYIGPEIVSRGTSANKPGERTPWEQRVIIDSAHDWHRNSQNMQFFAYLLGYTDEQMDDLFRAAMAVAL